jgi:phosphopantetheine adenylyltransferase
MKFNILVEELITKFAPNKDQETYAILPGGFKPPHKGHFNALNYLLEEADKGVVYIGKKERDGITAQQSKAIWDVYAKYLSKPITVEIASVSPINSAYDFVGQHPNSNVIVGVGPEEDPTELKRYDYFRKNADKFPLVKIVNIPAMNNRISGTQTRSLIKNKDKGAIDYFIPTESKNGKEQSLLASEDKNTIARILNI